MEEIITNLHIHTRYSDGALTHQQIARAAIHSGVDVIITTDHNVLVSDVEKYYKEGKRRVLLLAGEEIHNSGRNPQKSHLLVFGVSRELAPFASPVQRLIDQVNKNNGLSFLAHPYEDASAAFHEPDISWDDWDVTGYTGIELWNAMSELKSVARSRAMGAFYALFPQAVAHGPHKLALKKWDDLLVSGQRLTGVTGSDAHALPMRLGPFPRTIFPYEFHFSAINNHLLLPRPLSGDVLLDRQAVYQALRNGNSFIGYDLPAPTRGFRFTAQGEGKTAIPGDEIPIGNGITIQIKLPIKNECHLLRNGEVIKSWKSNEICTLLTNRPGVYRVETYIHYFGKRRGWIFSNPIYVTENNGRQ